MTSQHVGKRLRFHHQPDAAQVRHEIRLFLREISDKGMTVTSPLPMPGMIPPGVLATTAQDVRAMWTYLIKPGKFELRLDCYAERAT